MREKFLNSNFTFQNESLKFRKLFNLVPNAFNSLTSKQIDKVLNGVNLKVHEMIENETFYIEREFKHTFLKEIYMYFVAILTNGHFGNCIYYSEETVLIGTFKDYLRNFTRQNYNLQRKEIGRVEEIFKNCDEILIFDGRKNIEMNERLSDYKIHDVFEDIYPEITKTKI